MLIGTRDKSPSGVGLIEGDSWSNWAPDPERAFSEHDPTLEPYASMSKEELLERMRDAKGGREWEFLREFLLDKCTEDELRWEKFLSMLRVFSEFGDDEFCFLSEAAGPATRLRPHAAPCPSEGGGQIPSAKARGL
jgi:hypothetical protein